MTVQETYFEIEKHLNEIRTLFTKDCEPTFVMRHKSNPKCYMVVSNDDLDEVALTVLKSKELPERKG